MKNLNSLNLGKGLSRSEMKNVFGGNFYLAGPCDGFRDLRHESTGTGPSGRNEYSRGMCTASTGGTSCHNYCCTANQPTY